VDELVVDLVDELVDDSDDLDDLNDLVDAPDGFESHSHQAFDPANRMNDQQSLEQES
jgi:hypothetical protein